MSTRLTALLAVIVLVLLAVAVFLAGSDEIDPEPSVETPGLTPTVAPVARETAPAIPTAEPATREAARVTLTAAPTATEEAGSVASDRAALVAFFESTWGVNWENSTNWLTERPLGEWFGVRTDDTGRVTELQLGPNNLQGSLPPELGALTSLRELDLGTNFLLRGPLPAELGNLTNLEVLSLSPNPLFDGPIPPELGRLVKLRVLDLSTTSLSGPIPAELANLTNLEFLYLGDTELSGCVPANLRDVPRTDLPLPGLPFCLGAERVPSPDRAVLVAFFEATSGVNWHDSTNWLSDRPLGEWYGVRTDDDGRVTELQLHSNALNGPIPVELSGLANLERLWLHGNQLNGLIPAELSGLANLRTLYLTDNQLSGPIPPELSQLSNLTELFLSNNQLSGPIVDEQRFCQCKRAATLSVPALPSEDAAAPFWRPGTPLART